MDTIPISIRGIESNRARHSGHSGDTIRISIRGTESNRAALSRSRRAGPTSPPRPPISGLSLSVRRSVNRCPPARPMAGDASSTSGCLTDRKNRRPRLRRSGTRRSPLDRRGLNAGCSISHRCFRNQYVVDRQRAGTRDEPVRRPPYAVALFLERLKPERKLKVIWDLTGASRGARANVYATDRTSEHRR
jgi:hypothetical protein